jgi:hypothetical protein
VRTVPGVRKAVKWHSPFYGVEGQGWFLGIHCFAKYVKVAFFRATSLRPLPPDWRCGTSTAELAAWVKQASQSLGERM